MAVERSLPRTSRKPGSRVRRTVDQLAAIGPAPPIGTIRRTSPMRLIIRGVLTTLTVVALAACGSTATPAPSTGGGAQPSVAPSTAGGASAAAGGGAACAAAPAGATATVNVSIKNFKFNPQPVQAKVGDVVAWKNDDSAPHSATLDDGSCDTDQIAIGSSAMLTFTKAGTYTYHCKVHPAQMKDYTVVVQ
jgi:plastocyanin